MIATEIELLLLELFKKAPDSRCLWVSPPQLRNVFSSQGMIPITHQHQQTLFNGIQKGIQQVAQKTQKNCELMDSRSISYPPTGGDGIHHWDKSQTEGWIKTARDSALKILKN